MKVKNKSTPEEEEKFKQIAIELHKPARKHFTRRKIIPHYVDETWSADLIDLKKFSQLNNHFKYIFTIIDNYSKYAWALPLKNKTAPALVEAFEKLLKTSGRKPDRLWFDRESGIYSKQFSALMKENDIHLYSTNTELKAVIVERFNKTLENRIFPIMTYRGEQKWYDILPTVMDEYNKSVHSTIKMSPVEASSGKHNINFEENKHTLPKFKVGDYVRISKIKSIFAKGYTINWSYELFRITEVLKTRPPTYRIEDENNEQLEGSWYEPELQKSKFTWKTQVPIY